MSNFLAIDTSSKHLNVVAVKGDRVVQKFLPDCALSHSVRLMQEVDNALSEAELASQDCDFFAAVTGPGSFTGIRIGIATAKGFAVATGKKLLPVTAFELIAYSVSIPRFLAVIDAAHGHVYAQEFNGMQQGIAQYLSMEEATKLGIPLCGYEPLPFDDYTRIDIRNALLEAVKGLQGREGDRMEALYVRKSQAEEGRK